MASEYVSFMLVFSLGISMVVGITASMQNISESVFETSANVELEKIADKITGIIINGVAYEHQWTGNVSYEVSIDLTRLLVNKYSYEFTTSLDSDNYNLVGRTVGTSTNVTYSQSLSLNSNDAVISGIISSSSSNGYISFTKSDTAIVIIFGNR